MRSAEHFNAITGAIRFRFYNLLGQMAD